MAAVLSLARDVSDLPEYPVSKSERLESHSWFEWHHNRWLSSRLCLLCDPVVGFYALNLFSICQNEAPVGTLPTEERLLARLLGIDLGVWQDLSGREISPLYNWHPVNCEGEVRLAHPVVTELVTKAIGKREDNVARRTEERHRKRLNGIRTNLVSHIPGGKNAAANPMLVERINAWIEAAYPNGSATVARIQEAWEALSMG